MEAQLTKKIKIRHMKTKPWVTTEIYTSSEQKVLIQPSPDMVCLEMYIKDAEGDGSSNALYINKDELPVIISKLQEMMDYLTK